MNWKLVDRLTAAAVFVFALVLYLFTVAPTVSFWDPGERIAVSYGLQIPHPPGAPFYMLVGRFFSMVATTDYVALAVNLISVLSAAGTVLLAYLIILQFVREWSTEPRSAWPLGLRIAAYAGGMIGALTLAVSDSFWFNAVEAETYAFSTFFTALCVWLALKWSERAQSFDQALKQREATGGFGTGTERWLFVIAYLYGLAIGVHLLSLLSLFFVALIVFFRRFDNPAWTWQQRWAWIVATGAIASAVFLLLYPGIIQMLPAFLQERAFPLLTLLGFALLIVFAVYYTQTRRLEYANMVAVYLLLAMIGYSSYALIPIRSATNPPIDQNNPETVEAFVSYMQREQYGQRPLLTGPTYDNRTGQINREQESFFPRRWSEQSPAHLQVYSQYNSDWQFLWQYQIGHMYARYFLWNFMGRASDLQDAPAITGISWLDATSQEPVAGQTPSEEASRSVYYGLPLLLGLFGLFFHFAADWRRAFSLLIFFLITSVGIILYLHQTPMQPRERDYSYAGSFFAFSLWVGIGGTGLLLLARDLLADYLDAAKTYGAMLGLGGLLLLAVPGLMLSQNYFTHDRSGNYVANDYAYNLLMSLEENAIVFTNGDNDTFPLWYLQEVEGIRQDVRVVNLSLLQTPWYVRQLKHQQARDSAPLPISMDDDMIDDLSFVRWTPREVTLPVDTDALVERGAIIAEDTDAVEAPMRWEVTGREIQRDLRVLFGSDIALLDILQTNAQQGWERPIYFAITVAPDGMLNLQNYFQLEGKAFRVVPIRHDRQLGRVVPGITDARLDNFRLRNVNSPDVYFDQNARQMLDNYRRIYAHAAEGLAEAGYPDRGEAALDWIMEYMPFETLAGDERSYVNLARAYEAVGAQDRAISLLQQAEPLVLTQLEQARTSRDQEYAAQFVQLLRFTYLDANAFEEAAAFSDRLADLLQDDSFRESAEELRARYEDVDAEDVLPDAAPDAPLPPPGQTPPDAPPPSEPQP